MAGRSDGADLKRFQEKGIHFSGSEPRQIKDLELQF